MGDATNPWSAEGWNLTAQSQYIRQYGLARAEARARDAGSRVGATKPPLPVPVAGAAGGPFIPTPPAVWILRKEVVNLVPAGPQQLSTVGSVQEAVGITMAAIMYRELDLPAANPSLGFDAFCNVILEIDIAPATQFDLGVSTAVTITQSSGTVSIVAAMSLGLTQASPLLLELDLAASFALGVSESASLSTSTNPPTFQANGGFTTSTSTTSLSPALPAGRVNGDLLIAWFECGNARNISISGAGWTLQDVVGANPNAHFAWAWRYVDGTEAAVTFNLNSGSASSAGCNLYRNVKPTTPFGNHTTAAAVGGASPSILTTQNNSLVVVFAGSPQATPAFTTPTGFTDEATRSGTSAPALYSGGKTVASSGTTVNPTVTNGGTQEQECALVEILHP